jgi:hypothetical protein
MADHMTVSDEHGKLIREAAIACELGEHADKLVALARPSLVLATSRKSSSSIPVGATKIGGFPDVPESFEWPYWNRVPLTFVAQVNLSEIAPFQLGLPNEGLLSFFFCFEAGMEATREQSNGAGLVLLLPNDSLSRCKPPKRAAEPFDSCAVRFISYPSLPPAYADRVDELWGLDSLAGADLGDAQAEVIRHIDEALGIDKLSTSEGSNYHQLFGYPDPVQSTPIEIDMERARIRPPGPALATELRHALWEGFKNFIFSRKPDPYSTAASPPPPPVDLERCRQWQLLMMFREDEYAGIRLIDSGCLYFMYPDGGFREGQFDDVWTAVDYY